MAAVDFALAGRRVFVAGHGGLVGSAVARRLRARGAEVLTAPRAVDLRRQAAAEGLLRDLAPDAVVLAAARVGGIAANAARPAEFLYDNLAIAAAVVEASRRAGVAKLLFLGSSCIYPRAAPQPIPESALLGGPLEPTNEAYAVAKIAGLKLCAAYRRQYGCNYIAIMPCNLYGPGDNFDPASAHVVPALMRRLHAAAAAGRDEAAVWGSGRARREFLHVDDLAAAAAHLLERYAGAAPVNVGTGVDIAIAELAARIAETVGFRGRLAFDASKPDGVPRKVLDTSRVRALGWAPRIGLREGLRDTYRWFRARVAPGRPGGG